VAGSVIDALHQDFSELTGTPYLIPVFGVAGEGVAGVARGVAEAESVGSQEGQAVTCVVAMMGILPEMPSEGCSVAQCILLEVGAPRWIMARRGRGRPRGSGSREGHPGRRGRGLR